MKTTKWIVCALAILATGLGGAPHAAAQSYPSKPIRMIVPSTPGSPSASSVTSLMAT